MGISGTSIKKVNNLVWIADEITYKCEPGGGFYKRISIFLISLLCVNRNIPILGTTEDGNASDKTLNNELLGSVSKHMARHGLGPGAFVYVADSAFVTPDNLESADQRKIQFLTRLPATYKECYRAIDNAIGSWRRYHS